MILCLDDKINFNESSYFQSENGCSFLLPMSRKERPYPKGVFPAYFHTALVRKSDKRHLGNNKPYSSKGKRTHFQKSMRYFSLCQFCSFGRDANLFDFDYVILRYWTARLPTAILYSVNRTSHRHCPLLFTGPFLKLFYTTLTTFQTLPVYSVKP